MANHTLVPEALCEEKETRGEKEEPLVTSVANPTSTLDYGPFIIYDRGWAGKIQLITKQNVLTHPFHHKKMQ
jgi:hypothetical protein